MSIKETQVNKPLQSTETVVPLRPHKKPDKPAALTHTPAAPAKHVDKVLSCRYELKYRIRETKARAIAQYIQSYIEPDSYSRKCPDLEYPISSLYFDSEELHLCHETLNKKANRFKLRVRCYDDNPESPCFVEIKRRVNSVILKDRARLPKNLLDRVIMDYYVPNTLYKKDQDVLRQFQLYLYSLQAHPIVMVRYRRQAFEDDSSNRVRITFDRNLCYRPPQGTLLTTGGPGWQEVPMDFTVLEIKFTKNYPLWLNDLIKVFDLKQTAMSKYASSVKQSCAMGYCGPACRIGV